MKREPSWSKMWHEFFKPVCAGSGLIILAAWVMGISFYLFPWTGDGLEWWYIPHLVTTALPAIWLASIGMAMLDTIKDTKGEDDEE